MTMVRVEYAASFEIRRLDFGTESRTSDNDRTRSNNIITALLTLCSFRNSCYLRTKSVGIAPSRCPISNGDVIQTSVDAICALMTETVVGTLAQHALRQETRQLYTVCKTQGTL